MAFQYGQLNKPYEPTTPTGGTKVVNDQFTTTRPFYQTPIKTLPQSTITNPTSPEVLAAGANVPIEAPTTISNQNAIERANENKTIVEGLPLNGITVDTKTGQPVYANRTAYTPLQLAEMQPNQNIVEAPSKTAEKTQPTGTYVDYSGFTRPLSGDLPEGVQPDGQGGYLDPVTGIRYAPPPGDDSWTQKQIDDTNASIKANASAMMADAIDRISRNYDDLKQQQKEINASQEAGVKTGLLAGRTAQFASASYNQSLNAQIKYGQNQLKILQDQEDDALAKARSADYTTSGGNKVLNEQLTRLKDIQDKQIVEAEKLNDIITAAKQKAQETLIQSSRDSTVADLISQGITDPTKILNLLNYDEQGNQIGDFTMKEISDVMKSIADATGTSSTKNVSNGVEAFFSMLNAGQLPESITSLPTQSEQMFEFLKRYNQATSAKTATTTGGGASTSGLSTEETMIRTRLFSKLMNIINKGQVSDTDRAIIDQRIAQFRNAGMSEQEIMDKLSGFAVDVETPYNQSFRDLIVANTDTADQQTQLMGKVSLLLNSNNYTGALKSVENQAMIQAKKLDPDNYMGSATAENYLTKIERIRELAKKGGIDVISGTFNNLLGRLKGQEAAKLKAELTSLYAQFRKENLGTAVSESEKKFLTPLLADISDTKANFGEKLDAFERNLLDRYNSTRNSVNLPVGTINDYTTPQNKLSLYANPNISSAEIYTEDEAKNKVIDYGKSNPSDQTMITDLVTNNDPDLGRPMNYLEVFQYLKAIGKIK